MVVNNGENPRIPSARDKPLRKGYNKRHNFFEACFIIGKDFTMFFDYRCTNCYVAELLVKILLVYNSRKPAIIIGVEGSGLNILHDAIVTGRVLYLKAKAILLQLRVALFPIAYS
jgi:hypothetical protein